ncbi:NUDIX hydrolase [Ferruginibacter sp. SUN106]|uniref:NUDIX hydrolase n=1 Tax=Ferruginibacter sp. SUN106 TaxID=2978348 RepID=UPI003D364013
MSFEKEIKEIYAKGHEKYLRSISVDCIIFGFHENELKVLLLQAKYAGIWALPGGFIFKDEHMDDAAKRILQERTGVDDIYMQQFHVFSEPGRSTKKANKQFLKNVGIEMEESWLFDRFITVGYTALVDFSKVQPVTDILSSDCKWFNIHDIPEMILDHRNILDKALDDLRMQLNYHPLGYNLLPEKFTMPELQKLYETILDRTLDRRNFQRKIVSTGILKRLNETKKGVAHKAPYYYKFDLRKYQKALKGGMGFEL